MISTDSGTLIVLVLMFIILLCVIYRTLGEIPAFRGGPRGVLAVCISLLAVYGFDRAIVQVVVNQYVAMGAGILISVAALVFTTWSRLSKK